MIHNFAIITLITCFFIQINTLASEYTIDRYICIIERQPFGSEVSEEIKVNPIQDEKEALAAAKAAEKELRLCFIFETNQGDIRAGFQNKSAKKGDPKSITLGVGDNFRGMELIDININESTAILDRGGVKIMFSLAKAVSLPATTSVSQSEQNQRRFGRGFREQSQPKAEPKIEKPKLSPAEQAKRRDEIQENLRQYQMDVIRAGLPPLPVPLTKQMDDQLVAEGILPPE